MYDYLYKNKYKRIEVQVILKKFDFIEEKLSNDRKQDDYGVNVELISLLSNIYLLVHIGDKPTLQALLSECRPKNKRPIDIKKVAAME